MMEFILESGPEATSIEVLQKSQQQTFPLNKDDDGVWTAFRNDFKEGDLYYYRINAEKILPDPASRFQPQGVHGPSQIIDPRKFSWSDKDWRGISLKDAIIYELHVGTFTEEGTFRAAVERLPYLQDLGITCIELMPIADFPGKWNWGYDGVDLFAPARCYGQPDDLRRFVNMAHEFGLAVLVDVVYNHFGPDGSYAPAYSRHYFTDRHKTPWGDAINLDGQHSSFVRSFFIENALYWIHEFHMDGLRLDATHALIDASREHFLKELSYTVQKNIANRKIMLIAEDHRNLALMIQPQELCGFSLDGVWSDDFHHEMRRLIAGDCDGYFKDFRDSIQDLAIILRQGWLFCGQHSKYFGGPRGSDPAGLPLEKFVFFLQNHDQIGNRLMGERLNHQIDSASYRAMSVLLLCLPQTPLLFMGQEWAASSPFCYFTNHNKELGKQVTEGRKREFARFSAFSNPAIRKQIPDPQKEQTFVVSKLHWPELQHSPHDGVLRLYKRLLRLRKLEPALHNPTNFEVHIPAENVLLIRRSSSSATLLIVIQLKGSAEVLLPQIAGQPQVILTSEDSEFVTESKPPQIKLSERHSIRFARPGAVILRA